MKFYLCVMLVLAMSALSACTEKTKEASADDGGRLHIVVSIFPIYDWVINILGGEAENVDVTLLVDHGTDLHSFQPSAKDLVDIADCDIFVYVGGESDEWVSEALAQYENPDRTVISLMNLLGDAAKEEETAEGMQEESEGLFSGLFTLPSGDAEDEGSKETTEEDDADTSGGDDGGEETAQEDPDAEEEETEYDEHIWLSLKNAAFLTAQIADVLSLSDPGYTELYTANAQDYIAALLSLDADYQEAVDAASYDTLLFADRFAFRYLMDDYGLNYYAAFEGCSAETHASFETILFLAEKIDELGLNYVMISESGDTGIADTVIKSTEAKDAQILVLDSMQAVTWKDMEDGVTYLGIMEENLAVIRRALR